MGIADRHQVKVGEVCRYLFLCCWARCQYRAKEIPCLPSSVQQGNKEAVGRKERDVLPPE